MPRIIPRKGWNARTPKPNRTTQLRPAIKEFFLHWPGDERATWAATDTPEEEAEVMRNFQNFHMDTREWADFAYSFAVFPSGRIYRGRGMDTVPAAQEGHNTGTVACCIITGPDDALTPEIKEAVLWLHDHCSQTVGRNLTIRGHGEVYGTECPGPKIRAWIDHMRSRNT